MFIEEWPVELWLELLSYISLRDIIFGWFDLNTRLNALIVSVFAIGIRPFELDDNWTNSAFNEYLARFHSRLSRCVAKIILRDTCASRCLIKSSQLRMMLDNVRRLTLCDGAIYFFPDQILIDLVKTPTRLHELIIQFEGNTHSRYSCTLVALLENNISFHTMRLVVTDGNLIFGETICTYFHSQTDSNRRLCLAHTVRLTLTLPYWSHCITLLQAGSLPLLEDLDVSFDEEYADRNHLENHDNRYRSVDLSRLRSLRFCYVKLDKVHDFIRDVPSLTAKLDTLSLVRVRVENTNNNTILADFVEFRTLLISRLAAKLRRFQLGLLIDFSEASLLESTLRVFHTDRNTWPWPSICYQTEDIINSRGFSSRIYTLYIKHPFSWCSSRQRLSGESYVYNLNWHMQDTPPRRLVWSIEANYQMESMASNSSDVINCLRRLTRVNWLKWYIESRQHSILMQLQQQPSVFPIWTNMRCVTLSFSNYHLSPSRRIGILDNILQSACHLSSLTAPWTDVLNVAKTHQRMYRTVKRLCLQLHSEHVQENTVDAMEKLDPSAIACLFPCLHQLSTTGKRPPLSRFCLMPLAPLLSLVLSLMLHLSPQLTFIYLNDCPLSLPEQMTLSKKTRESVCSALESKLKWGTSVSIVRRDGLRIWL